MKRPTAGKLALAADWLRCYDTESSEVADILEVARWLEHQNALQKRCEDVERLTKLFRDEHSYLPESELGKYARRALKKNIVEEKVEV